MFCTLDSFSLLWLLNTNTPKKPPFFFKSKPLIVFSMISSLFCRYPEILNIHCTFLILVDINIHCHIKDIHVCIYFFLFSDMANSSVKFDENGDGIPRYTIYNYQKRQTDNGTHYKIIGKWQNTLEMDERQVMWSSEVTISTTS